jgi:hypothetical protein
MRQFLKAKAFSTAIGDFVPPLTAIQATNGHFTHLVLPGVGRLVQLSDVAVF